MAKLQGFIDGFINDHHRFETLEYNRAKGDTSKQWKFKNES
jgi:hypothetical protein